MVQEEWRKAIGIRFRSLRESGRPGRYSRRDLAAALRRTKGVTISESQIEKIESGKSFPGWEVVLAYREFFEVDFNYLLAEEKVSRPDYPDLVSSPGLMQYVETMRGLPMDEQDFMRHLSEMASHLTAIVLDSYARGKQTQGGNPKAKKAGKKKPG